MAESLIHQSLVAFEEVSSKKSFSVRPVTVSVAEISDSEDDLATEDIESTISNIDIHATHIQAHHTPDLANHLNLQDLTLPLRLFALALTHFTSNRTDYATAPYMDSFNWPSILSVLRKLCAQSGIEWQQQEFYLVIFRSRLQRTADRHRLGSWIRNLTKRLAQVEGC